MTNYELKVYLLKMCKKTKHKYLSCVACLMYFQSQPPEELQRLVTLVKEESFPADALPLPDKNPSADTGGTIDGGEHFGVQFFYKGIYDVLINHKDYSLRLSKLLELFG